MTRVVRREGESPESLLQRFRKQVTKDRILGDIKRKRFFVPKSEERRTMLRRAMRRERKRMWRERSKQHE